MIAFEFSDHQVHLRRPTMEVSKMSSFRDTSVGPNLPQIFWEVFTACSQIGVYIGKQRNYHWKKPGRIKKAYQGITGRLCNCTRTTQKRKSLRIRLGTRGAVNECEGNRPSALNSNSSAELDQTRDVKLEEELAPYLLLNLPKNSNRKNLFLKTANPID